MVCVMRVAPGCCVFGKCGWEPGWYLYRSTMKKEIIRHNRPDLNYNTFNTSERNVEKSISRSRRGGEVHLVYPILKTEKCYLQKCNSYRACIIFPFSALAPAFNLVPFSPYAGGQSIGRQH